MVQINFAQKQVNAKIVFYGPGMSGKTTNLEVIHQRAPVPNKGELTSISTDGDRTLFFDFMPLDLGTVAGMRTCFQIYTVPGQVYYNSTRKLVLQGVDGVVFVADSSASMMEENLESIRNLEQNLNEYGKTLATLPHIIQFNKRDLPDALPLEELHKLLNAHNAPCIEAIANTGQGVFPTLKALAARVLETIHTGARGAPGSMPTPAPAAPTMQPAGQTTYTQRQGQMAAPTSRPGQVPNAPMSVGASNGPSPRPAMPTYTTPSQTPRTAIPVAAEATGRTGFHPPPQQQHGIPMGGHPQTTSPNSMAATGHGSMHAPAGPQIMHGHGVPPGPSGHAGHPGMGGHSGKPGQGTSGSIQMMRTQEPMAPSPSLSSTGFNRPRPPAAARPAARPSNQRPTTQRPGAQRPATKRVVESTSSASSGKKMKITTTMLVITALVAGAILAFAVLT
jgi:signal recognition particle receptor subunit beta